MSMISKANFFKPTRSESKDAKSASASRKITDVEHIERTAKTARLKALRLEKQQLEGQAPIESKS